MNVTGKRVPKVTVGLPVYNGESYLPEAVECHLQQTFEDFELIIVDNASTDATQEVGRAYAKQDRRVRYVRNDRNFGIIQNFNKASRLAKGAYFTWSAHDDYYAPSFLERCVAALDNDPEVVLAYTSMRVIDKEGHTLPYDAQRRGFAISRERDEFWVVDTPRWSGGLASPFAPTRFTTALRSAARGVGFTSYGLIRTSALGEDPYSAYGGENLLVAKLSLKGRFQYITEPLIFFRSHSEQYGHKPLKERLRISLGHNPRRVYPLQVFLNYANAVKDADLSPAEKMRCGLAVLRHSVRAEKIKRALLPGAGNYWGLGTSR